MSCSSTESPSDTSSSNHGDEEEAAMQKRMDDLLAAPDKLRFRDIKELIFDRNCNSCHSGTNPDGGLSLESLEKIYTSGDDFLRAGRPEESLLYTSLMIEEGILKMPPDSAEALSDDQRELVYQWILKGAREEERGEDLIEVSLTEELQAYFESPETIDYSVVKKYVFEPGQCYSCHSDHGAFPDDRAILFGADFNSYNNLFLLGGIVKRRPNDKILDGGDQEVFLEKGSKIYQAIAVDQSMPPIEQGYRPLNALRAELLRLWILNGAIEDTLSLKRGPRPTSQKSAKTGL